MNILKNNENELLGPQNTAYNLEHYPESQKPLGVSHEYRNIS